MKIKVNFLKWNKTYFFIILSIIFLNSCDKKNGLTQIKSIKKYDINPPNFLLDTTTFKLSDYTKNITMNRFENEIKNLTKNDCDTFPKKEEILVVGSSSIRMWKTLIDDMKPLYIVQRGFGGATIPEVIQYSNKIVFRYKPAIVVFYCGENDHSWNNSLEISKTFQYFEKHLHSKLPDCKLYFVSIKPSFARKTWAKRMNLTNKLIKNYISTTQQTFYIDVASLMFDKDYKLKTDIFIEDNLHLNSKGYQIWTSVIKPILLKDKNLML